ncbi:hypothetical protein COBT_003126 [Conglomerata obtusa]
MHYIIFAILQFIETQKIFMYYVPQRPLSARNARKHGIKGIILIKPLNHNVMQTVINPSTVVPHRIPNQNPFRITKQLYVKRNRPDQVDNKTKLVQDLKTPSVKHVYNQNIQASTQPSKSEFLQSFQDFGGNEKLEISENKIESDSIDGDQNEDLRYADSNYEIESEESSGLDVIDIVNDSKFYAFYLKNKYLIFFEIALLTVLTILLVVRFEIYILPVKLYRKCFGKRMNARVQYEPMQPEVEEYSKNNQEIDENLDNQ